MVVDLTSEEVETLLTSLDYSKDRIRNAQDTPYAVRQESMARLDNAAQKLRHAKRASPSDD
jgi:hypothetical protein